MKKAILATKVGMTQIFNHEDGVLIPVTVLQAGPCVVTQVKTVENDGYSAVQVGYVDKKDKIVTKDGSGRKAIAHRNGVTKAEKGHFDKAGVSGKMQRNMLLLRRSKLISSQREITSMRQQSPKVKVSRARSNVTDRAEDL